MSVYVRVSRVVGRGGESYISPSVQEESIRKWAEGRGVEIIAFGQDADQSGGTQDRPALKYGPNMTGVFKIAAAQTATASNPALSA